MKLLIFAQKVDLRDSVLSFFHLWITELAKHFETVKVVCLYEGTHDLPANVEVFSLGKEVGVSRVKYVYRFFKYALTLRKDYDVVFVHQNQEYAILGGPLWKIMGKPVYMWRNHYAGSFLTDMAAFFCTKVFCTSKFSYTAKFKNTVFMPVGVDTEIFNFRPETVRIPHSILSVGRISPSKKLDQLIEALGILKKEGIDFSVLFIGNVSSQDVGYFESLERRTADLHIDERVTFKAGVPNSELPAIFSAHEIFVNLSPSGMFDKTIFEAMACGALALSCNKNLIGKIDSAYLFKEDDVSELTAKIRSLLELSIDDRRARALSVRKFVQDNHSLSMLGTRLAEEMRSGGPSFRRLRALIAGYPSSALSRKDPPTAKLQ